MLINTNNLSYIEKLELASSLIEDAITELEEFGYKRDINKLITIRNKLESVIQKN